jgi:type VI secretion system secreted protein VgrG
MADFFRALPFLLRHEGGWSDNPADPGGATNFGITLAEAQRHGIPDATALLHITPDQVAAIYKADYWRFDGLTGQAVATKLLDMAANMGLGTAVKLAQGALNGIGAGLQEDGHYGPATEASLNAVDPSRVVGLLCQASADHYRDIVSLRPASGVFLRGWLNRAAEVPNG